MLPLADANPTRRRAVVTLVLIAINVGVYLLLQAPRSGTDVVQTPAGRVEIPADLRFTLEYAAIPCEITQGHPLTLGEAVATFARGNDQACSAQLGGPELFPSKNVHLALVTSMFLHASLIHLAGNMLFLWVFGNNIEDHLGRLRYLGFYLLGGLAAGMAHVLAGPSSTVPVVGASGAVAAVMGAYLVWFPLARIHTLFFLFVVFWFPIQARWLLLFWFVSQFFVGADSNVAWVAHVAGFLFGAAAGLAVRFSPLVRRLTWRREFHTSPAFGVGSPGALPPPSWPTFRRSPPPPGRPPFPPPGPPPAPPPDRPPGW